MQVKVFSILFMLTLTHMGSVCGQPFKFAHVTDTHVGGSTGVADLENTVADINAQSDLDFVIISGDITEFGADDELAAAKQLLDRIRIPWYVIPGNHDTNWSESGGNSFRKVFDDETFAFVHKGYRFVGTNSGPNMRMSPGQVPRENLVWMDSLFAAQANDDRPLVYINHYPQDSSLNNWFEAIDRVKRHNVQLFLCGHGHQNKEYDFEGIPSVMGRSNLRASDSIGGYNIVTMDGGNAIYQERNPGVGTKDPWATIPLENHRFAGQGESYPRPDYSVNESYTSQLSELWAYHDKSDVGAGMVQYKSMVITANTAGEVYALDTKTGERRWAFQTGGKVYSTPAVWKQYLVFGSSDHFVYCLDARTGILKWKYEAGKAVLGSPIMDRGVVFIGASDNRFRAFDVQSGELLWSFDDVKGYISSKPLFYRNKLYFGCWGNGFYAVDPRSGELLWQWSNGSTNRMLSPAACYPVGSNGRIFLVAPDRYMTALDADSGQEIWRTKVDSILMRESMGLSSDGQLVYVKTMDGQVLGVSTHADSMLISWKSALQLPYELTPSAIHTDGRQVFVPSHSGLLSAVDARTGSITWQYKISNAMVNPVLVLGKRTVVASTMDGRIVKLAYRK